MRCSIRAGSDELIGWEREGVATAVTQLPAVAISRAGRGFPVAPLFHPAEARGATLLPRRMN